VADGQDNKNVDDLAFHDGWLHNENTDMARSRLPEWLTSSRASLDCLKLAYHWPLQAATASSIQLSLSIRLFPHAHGDDGNGGRTLERSAPGGSNWCCVRRDGENA
jgi:hypothetical protein